MTIALAFVVILTMQGKPANSPPDRGRQTERAQRDLAAAARSYKDSLEKLLKFQEADLRAAEELVQKRRELYTHHTIDQGEVDKAISAFGAAKEKVAETKRQIAQAEDLVRTSPTTESGATDADPIDKILNLMDKALAVLDIPRNPKMSRTTATSAGKHDLRIEDQLKETSTEVRRLLDELMKEWDKLTQEVIGSMEDRRKFLRELADRGVIEFQEGISQERALIEKERNIQTQHIYNKLDLISNIKGLLLWESGMTATSQNEPPKQAVRKRKAVMDDQARLQQVRQLLEALKVTLQVRKDWLRAIWDQKKT